MQHKVLAFALTDLKKEITKSLKELVGTRTLSFTTPYPINDEYVIVSITPSLSVTVTDEWSNEEVYKLKDYSLDIQVGLLKELEDGNYTED